MPARDQTRMELMNGRVAEEMTEARKEARKALKAANLIDMVTWTKEALETRARAQGQGQERNPVLLRLQRAKAYWSVVGE